MKISFVMPALNEEEGIGKTIDSIPVAAMKKKGHSVEIIVVDGGSKDKTVEIAREHGAKVISSERGYGRQYKAGFAIATGDIIVTGDSDGSYPFDASIGLIDTLLEGNWDFITTNRFASMEPGSMTMVHKFGNFMLTLFTQLLFGVGIKDSQSGMWVFRRNILKDLKLIGDGMPMSEELKIEAFKKFKATEVPIVFRKRIGKVKLNTLMDGWDNLSFLFYKRLMFK